MRLLDKKDFEISLNKKLLWRDNEEKIIIDDINNLSLLDLRYSKFKMIIIEKITGKIKPILEKLKPFKKDIGSINKKFKKSD